MKAITSISIMLFNQKALLTWITIPRESALIGHLQKDILLSASIYRQQRAHGILEMLIAVRLSSHTKTARC